MKRLFILMLVLILLSSTAIAESAPAREFTVDEQAYDVYLDVSYVHNQSVRYLSELERLWDLANKLDDISDADALWFHAGLVADFGSNNSENGSRLLKFHLLATEKYGFNQVPDLYPAFKELLSAYSGKTTDIIWAGLAMGIEAQYIISPDELKTYLDEAMQGIRSIMSKDRGYPFLKDLQNYYKEASYLLDYISNFKDNYIGCQEMLDTQKKNQSSYTINFEFIFDPADFDYVMEVGAAEAEKKEKEIYESAVALENSGNYAGAIELYWQCSTYEDSINRLKICYEAIYEPIYQTALGYENSREYQKAIDIYSSLGNYKDTNARLTQCKQKKIAYAYEVLDKEIISFSSMYLNSLDEFCFFDKVCFGQSFSEVKNCMHQKGLQTQDIGNTLLQTQASVLGIQGVNIKSFFRQDLGSFSMREYLFNNHNDSTFDSIENQLIEFLGETIYNSQTNQYIDFESFSFSSHPQYADASNPMVFEMNSAPSSYLWYERYAEWLIKVSDKGFIWINLHKQTASNKIHGTPFANNPPILSIEYYPAETYEQHRIK